MLSRKDLFNFVEEGKLSISWLVGRHLDGSHGLIGRPRNLVDSVLLSRQHLVHHFALIMQRQQFQMFLDVPMVFFFANLGPNVPSVVWTRARRRMTNNPDVSGGGRISIAKYIVGIEPFSASRTFQETSLLLDGWRAVKRFEQGKKKNETNDQKRWGNWAVDDGSCLQATEIIRSRLSIGRRRWR